jgi:hypothetical protein
MSTLNEYDTDDYLLYECENITYSATEGTIILRKPNKTLLCTQTIILDKPELQTLNILKFYAILSLTLEKSKTHIIYTVTIEKVSNGILSGEIYIEEFTYYSYSYISDKIKIISIDKEKKHITFNKNDIAIIKIYGSSDVIQNKIITSPKLLNAVFGFQSV